MTELTAVDLKCPVCVTWARSQWALDATLPASGLDVHSGMVMGVAVILAVARDAAPHALCATHSRQVVDFMGLVVLPAAETRAIGAPS